MEKLVGIIDLGSNTFHLLILGLNKNGTFREVFKQRDFVALGEGGLGLINPQAFERGINTLKSYFEILNQEGIKNIRAIGTAALRSANNGSDFIEKARDLFGLDIELIDGNREAELIYKGVKLLLPNSHMPYLIMDIGGGSVEFIIIQDGEMEYAESFNVGIAQIHSKYCKNDPISDKEIREISYYLNDHLINLHQALSGYEEVQLVGSSGSFEILENMTGLENNKALLSEISIKKFEIIYQKIVHSNQEERENMPNLPKERAKLVVPALILMNYIIEKVNANKIIVCPYALKEGLASELI
jgi:exopolyphosphatase/guanosine-5'-triphosphate,3'-diphosphate pyrophosphatase